MTQLTLLPSPQPTTDVCPITWHNDIFDKAYCDQLLTKSLELDWLHNDWSMMGQSGKLPRKEIIFGDSDYTYSYSNGRVVLTAQPWPIWLKCVRDIVEQETGYKFPLVIGNLYEGGHHHIGWHDDGRPELGENPAIASLSLGVTRKFQMRRKGKGTEIFNYQLSHGDLLLMQPGCQENWLHKVAKTSKEVGVRFNWTFRPWDVTA